MTYLIRIVNCWIISSSDRFFCVLSVSMKNERGGKGPSWAVMQ
jgi:hypothetical protein